MVAFITDKEATKRIYEILAAREAELEKIRKSLREAEEELKTANIAIEAATEVTNLEAFETATAEKRKAETAISMYTARLNQLNSKQIVSEEESDSVIAGLLAYEKNLEADFLNDVRKHVIALEAISSKYHQAVKDTERVIREWCEKIHANYRSETGGRMDYPVKVHSTPFTGCAESEKLKRYLDSSSVLQK